MFSGLSVNPISGRVIMSTSRLCRLVLCILHAILFFAKAKNENPGKNDESSLADICDVTSRDYIVLFP